VSGDNASLNLNGHCCTVGQVVLTDGSIVNGSGAAVLTGSSYIVMKGAITASLAGNGGLTKITNDLVALSGANTYSGLTTVSAGELRMIGSAAWNMVFNEGGVDVQGGKLVFDYANDSSPAFSIVSILDASYGDGSSPFAVGNSAKIYSSTAKNAGMALGWADDGAGSVTVMYTLYGDANLDNAVNGLDLSTVLAAYNKTNQTWAQGDFTYDGDVNSNDLGKVLANYNRHLANPSLALSGADAVGDDLTYTLTFGQVTGVAVQSYMIDWGDGASPEIYTAAQIQALNGQVTHTYASGSISPTITVDLIDNNGVTYFGVAGKHVAANTAAAHVSTAPVISNFYCINEISDFWTLTGTVTDRDDPVKGDIVTFGGVLASYNLKATVGVDGVFDFTVEIRYLQEGTATAQTTDPHGVLSNLAVDWVIV
jgi:autotransporter-associated beta strand protein